ncbi:Riboflavin synthase [bacterium HR21]|nr:Riboflavin synthase [bacterium HR21]
MFTGIVEARGRLLRRQKTPTGVRLWIEAPELAAELLPGASIAVSGVCLTVAGTALNCFWVDVIPETLRKTTLGRLRRGATVNLERALALTGRLDGHLVSGHVDCISRVRSVEHSSGEHHLWIALPAPFQQYAILHGSICVDGVSLTIARLRSDAFMVALIPTTLERTTLGELRPGSWVNLEFDLVAKYIERLLRPYLRLFFQKPQSP